MSKTACGCAVFVMLALMNGVARADTQQQSERVHIQHFSQSLDDCDHQPQNWFPPAMQASSLTSSLILPASADSRDQAIAPVPPAAVTGLAGLTTLGLIHCR